MRIIRKLAILGLLLLLAFGGILFYSLHVKTDPASHPLPISIQTSHLPPLPTNIEGAFVTSIKDTIVVAGGVRPSVHDEIPQAGSFVKQVFLLPADAKRWQVQDLDLSLAFGGSAALPDGLICVGGLSPDGISAQVHRLTLGTDESGKPTVRLERLPDLPEATAFAGAAVKDDRLHVMGGITALAPTVANARHLILPLTTKEGETKSGWQRHGDIPGLANTVAPAVGIRRDDTSEHDALYLAGGWTLDSATDKFVPTGRAFRYLDKFEHSTAWKEMAPPPGNFVFNSALPLGPSHWLVLGLVDPAARSSVGELCSSRLETIGFLNYHTFTDTWVELPWRKELRDAVAAGRGRGFAVIAAQAPGETKSTGLRGELLYNARHFTWVDYLTLGLYMLSLVGIGFWCARQEKDTDEFFLGSRNIPWWAAGLSIYATGISAISFMAIPAKTYATNWVRLGEPLAAFFAMMIAGFLFVPLLRRLQLTTMMEYAQLRFNLAIRLMSSFLAVASQVAGRMAVVLLLPSVALAAVTGFKVEWCVVAMGVLATLYTVLGGIRAVIWTDVLQFFVLFGGALLAFILILFNVDGGLGGVINIGSQYGKFHTFDFTWDFTTVTVWVIMLWGIGDIMGRLGQEGMQRAFATKGANEARNAMITCAVVSVPGALLFFAIGAGLFAFYHLNPQLLNPTLETDSVFPLFIAQQLPVGIGGLVIAGLFAAAMSTLDSAMNSVATIVTRDWFSLFNLKSKESTRLFVARAITVVCGVLGTGMALYMATLEIRSLWDAFARVMGLIGGTFAGISALALLTKRANWLGALLGGLINLLILNYVRTNMHFLIYGITFKVVGFVFGYLFSVLIDMTLSEELRIRWKLKKDLTGLTIWTARKR